MQVAHAIGGVDYAANRFRTAKGIAEKNSKCRVKMCHHSEEMAFV